MNTTERSSALILLWLAIAVFFFAFAVVPAVRPQSNTCNNGDMLLVNTGGNKNNQCLPVNSQPAGTGTTMQIANDTVTGTTVNRLAKLTSAPSKAIITATSDTENAIGIVTSGAGNSGTATVTILGQASCEFDNATVAGDYFTISATTAGKCHDAGASWPQTGATYGRVLTTNGGAGTYTVEIMTPDVAFQNAGNGKSKPGTPNNSVQFNGTGNTFQGDAGLTYTTAGSGQLFVTGGTTTVPGIGIGRTDTGLSGIGGSGITVGFISSGGLRWGIDDDIKGTNFGAIKWSSTSSQSGSADAGLCRTAVNQVSASKGDNFCSTGDFLARNYTSTQGTITTSTPFFSHTGTWNAGGVTFTNFLSNVTDTASANGSKWFDFQKGGTSIFRLEKVSGTNNKLVFANAGDQIVFGGNSVLTGNTLELKLTSGDFVIADSLRVSQSGSTPKIYAGGNVSNAGGISFTNNQNLGWVSSSSDATGSQDIGMSRNAAGVLEINKGNPTSAGSESDLRDVLSRHYFTGKTTTGNCADSAGAAACGAAAAGSVVIDAGSTSVVVSTTSVTADSQVFVQFDSSLGTRLGITCNTTVALPAVTARTAATSFTITIPAAPTTNPACYSYFIVN